ncbi:hypothetical protein FNF27_07538 [Cafeteria roenbergensis]|uniref:Dynein regulatory complex subunit 3 n=1 Tax=Cafeteria roenbergensis TaxID=33653 RepID=A0A5A8DL76_CAFRO|nr:hypothetical protein FNF27_07538 [Cafeteria roenbergensis]
MASVTGFFAYAVEKPKARHPPHGVINEQLIKAAIDEERALVEEECMVAADAAGSSAAQMSVKDLQAQLARRPVWEDVTHDRLTSLTLSFRSLAAIANLETLSALTTLRLDNNSIAVIEGLSSLVNLTWLDLSFNSITKIEGLDTLTKLTDLSLANNRIEEIRGLDKCESLEFLSLANNRLARVAQAQALRPLPKLRAVAIMGNPACAAEDDYRAQLLMWLPRLEWVDFKAVSPAQHQAAVDAEAQLPEGLVRREKAQEEAAKHEAETAAQRREQLAHGLHHLAALWDRMSGKRRGRIVAVSREERAADDDDVGAAVRASGAGALLGGSLALGEDADGESASEDEDEDEETAALSRKERERILRLPGVRIRWGIYSRTVQEIVSQGLKRAGAVARRIQAETAAADAALDSVRATASAEASAKLATFLQGLKRLQRQLTAGASLKAEPAAPEAAAARARVNHQRGADQPLSAAAAAAAIDRFRRENDELREALLVAELRANEQATEVIGRFEVQHTTLATERGEAIDLVLREAEVAEKRFAGEVRGLVLSMVERLAAGQPIAAERGSLSLECIRDGQTLARFGVPSTRERPDVEGDGPGGAGARDAADGAAAEPGAASGASASSAGDAGSAAGDSADRVLVQPQELCEDLASLLEDKELADSALSDAEAARMEQLLAVSDACKAWQKSDKDRVVMRRRKAELRATRERCEEIAAVWEANRDELEALMALDV